METLKVISEWNRALASVIAAIGSDEFFPKLIAAVRERVPIAYPQVWLYHRDLPPRVLYHEVPPDAAKMQIDAYLDGPYQEAPFYQTSVNRPRSRIYRLSRVTAGRLEQSDYYRDYYADTGTVDEAIFLSQLRGGNVINLSMMRLPHQGVYSEDEYQLLNSLSRTRTSRGSITR